MSVVSGIFQSEATKDAANTASDSSKAAADVQYKMFLEQQAAMEPWRASGVNALNQLNALMGLPQYQQTQPASNATVPGGGGVAPTAPVKPTMGQTQDWGIAGPPDGVPYNPSSDPSAAMAKYNQDYAEYTRQLAAYNAGGAGNSRTNPSRLPAETQATPAASGGSQDWKSLMDPGYAFRQQEGINALAAAGAASGNYGSGNMGVALQDFGQNLASQEFQNVYNRLAGMSGTGQVQSQSMGNVGVQTGGVMANYLNQAGQNIAQGQVSSANALAGGARDAENAIASYYMYGGGGGAGNTALWTDIGNEMPWLLG